MDEFEKVEMSYKNRGLPSLFSQPLYVEILLGPSKQEVHEILKGSFYAIFPFVKKYNS